MNFSGLTLPNEKLYYTIYVALCGDKPYAYLNLLELFNLTSNNWEFFSGAIIHKKQVYHTTNSKS